MNRQSPLDAATTPIAGSGAPAANQPMTDNVNNPAHYTSHPARCECGRSIECIQITEHANFCIGSAQKYLWRADLKHDDDGIEDLRKAAWYINREIKRRLGK